MRTSTVESNTIEKELIEATQFVPEKRYRKRQDYLGALMRAVCDLSDPAFDKLSDPAADWSCMAVEAFKLGNDLPDFGDAKASGTDSTNGHAVEDVEHTEVTAEDVEHTEVEASEAEPSTSEETEKPAKKPGKKPGRPKGCTKKAKEAKAPKETNDADEAPVRIRVNGTNKWGVLIGSKSDIVCQMLARENGATMEEIKEATGHYHYNLCNRLRRHGFKVEKNGLRIRLAD